MVEPVFRYEPLSYLLKNGLPELSMECWENMDDGFHGPEYSPAWDRYQEMETSKDGGFVSMREDGRLIGYAMIKVNPDIHQKHLRVALLHDIYITSSKRGYAIKFFNYLQNFASMLGAYRMDVAERLSFDSSRGGAGKFYDYIGFKPMEVIWSKILSTEGNA